MIKNNLYNFFINKQKCNYENRMWTTFLDYKGLLKGKGYSKGFIAYNLRATNNLPIKLNLHTV